MAPAERPLQAAVRPLRFAARNGFANLQVVKGLEAAVLGALERAAPALDPEERARAEAVREALVGSDAAPLEARRAAVAAALAAVDGPPPSGPEAGRPPGGASSGAREGRSVSTPPPSGDVATSVDPLAHQPRRPAGKVPVDLEAALPSAKAVARAAPQVEAVTPPRRVPMPQARPEHVLSGIVGVGPKTAEKLAAKGVVTARDALFFFPLRYEDRSQVRSIERLRPGEKAVVEGVVAASAARLFGRKKVWEIALRDGTGTLSCRFFRFSRRELEGRYPRGTRVRAFGPVTFFGRQPQMAHPELERIEGDAEPGRPEPRPVYPDVPGVAPKTLAKVLEALALEVAEKLEDPLPAALREAHGLALLGPAVRAAHLPSEGDRAVLHHLRRRLAFDELFYLQLALGASRAARGETPGLAHDLQGGWPPLAERALPFSPTAAQARVLDDIANDLAAPRPMSRLLQGDVGSGKTAVALLSAALVAKTGRQVALLAPTEILAEQHAKSAHALLGKLGLQMALLTGSLGGKARAALLRALARGDVDVLVGTHALLEEDVRFRDLGLAVIDEQHRFGVEQRARLLAKREGPRPDVLAMTATPIPRTLTLSLYGDLEVSVIDELPPGRSPTKTRVYGADRAEEAHAEVRRALDAGRQAYVVFPLVEASDQLDLKAATDAVAELEATFAPHRVALLHGKMRSDEKSEVMQAFARGEVGVLVATTVIEVGVDVPNATVMVIEEADRFGLSQLHQLRGRVGRGRHQGLCLLVAGAGADAGERLSVMAETSDGFVIAERDLELRGPGEVLGTRQSGLPDLAVANLAGDGRLLEAAREAADTVLAVDPELTGPALAGVRAEVQRRFGEKLARMQAG